VNTAHARSVRETATGSVSPRFDSIYNKVACQTDDCRGGPRCAETVKEFPSGAYAGVGALTFDNLSSERHGVRSDMRVLPCFSGPRGPGWKKELSNKLDTQQDRVCTLQMHLIPVF
jgi:hypothetical protein